MAQEIRKDLTGQRFGKLTVLKLDDNTKRKRSIWLCQCDCGNTRSARTDSLIDGHTKSCGCLSHRLRKDNPTWKGYGDISATKFRQIVNDAKNREITFEVTIEQIWNLFLKQKRKCALSGINLKFASNHKSFDGNASLDRIDSSKGYTIDNLQWIDKRINFMKRNFNVNEFIFLCKTISDFQTNAGKV